MAALDGNNEYPTEAVLAYGNPALGSFPDIFDHLSSFDPIEAYDSGADTDTQPVVEPANAHDGNLEGEFGMLDFYFHIHVQYAVIGLGAVVNDITFPFYIFNGYLEPRTLNAFGFIGDPGIDISAPHGAPPVDYAPLEVKTYNLTVERNGPAVITGQVTFEFDVRSFSIPVTGIRVLAWRWSPNWKDNVRERLEWFTDVQRAYSGREQRRRLREDPRQYLEFTFEVDDDQHRILESTLYNWGARLWLLPFFPDVLSLLEDLPSGSDIIPIDTTTRTYAVGELIMFVAPGDTEQEAIQVAAIEDDHIETTQPTSRDWPPGTLVYPAKLARLIDGPALARFLKDHSYGVASFVSFNGAVFPTATEATYRSQPVLLDGPNRDPDYSTQYQRQLELVDFGVGISDVDDQSLIPDQVTAHTRLMTNRAELGAFRGWAYAREGRLKALWVPSFVSDLILVAPLTSVATTINFKYAGLVDLTEAGQHRKDVRIELMNGAVYYRRLSNPAKITDDIERMDLSSPIGVDVGIADVKIISWMAYSRLDSDVIEIAWDAPHVAESLTVFRSFRNDV